MKREGEGDSTSPYHTRLEDWIAKELQLNILHEEIINRREALLRSARNVLQSHTSPAELSLLNNQEALVRNDMLLADARALEEYVTNKQAEPSSVRFSNLQANYKSMVESMFPIWQKSLLEIQESAVLRDKRK